MRSQRHGRNDASIVSREFSGLLQPLVTIDELDLKRGLDIFDREGELRAFDCILAAAAIRRGVPLVSADRAFRTTEGLTVLDPIRDLKQILER